MNDKMRSMRQSNIKSVRRAGRCAGRQLRTVLQDDRGVTLIELLLSFAVSTVVLAVLSLLLFTGLRLYDRNEAGTRVQNEAQNALNLLTDHLMEAQGVCMEETASDAALQCILLDDLQIKQEPGGYLALFDGEALVVQLEDSAGAYLGEMYLLTFPTAEFGTVEISTGKPGGQNRLAQGAATPEAAAEQARQNVQTYLTNMAVADRRAWLMADHVTSCEITPAAGVSLRRNTVHYADGTAEQQYFYSEPFGFTVRLALEMQSQTGGSARTVEDTVYIRNKLRSVYVKKGGSMQEYLPE